MKILLDNEKDIENTIIIGLALEGKLPWPKDLEAKNQTYRSQLHSVDGQIQFWVEIVDKPKNSEAKPKTEAKHEYQAGDWMRED